MKFNTDEIASVLREEIDRYQSGIDVREVGQVLEVGEEGELEIRGYSVMSGYLNNAQANSDAFTEDNFFKTGDLAIVDVDQNVRITGRVKDIINRGGATLVVELFGSDSEGGFAEDQGGTVYCDGLRRDFSPGEKLRLAPVESVTLIPGDWHAFWGDGGDVLIGEVSTVNDDNTDNIFREPIGRFSDIEEDEAPRHLLVSDYDQMLPAA